MSNKGNAALAVDREAISAYHIFAQALNNELDQNRTEIKPSISYLTEDENISGGDTEAFKESLESLNGILVSVKTKIETIAMTVGRMSNMASDNAAAKRTNLKQARENMGKAIMAMKQTGK